MASFEKRGKKWRAVVSYTNARGLRQKTSKTFDLKKAATVWAAETETKVNGGLDLNAGNISFPDYYMQWVNTYKRDLVRESTLKNYISRHKEITKLFSNVPLNKLTTSYIQKQINLYGKTHSKGYVGLFLSTIKSSLKDAMIDGLIDRDIYSRLKTVGQDTKKFENYLSASDFKTLQTWLYKNKELMLKDNLYLAVIIALETGARYGEIKALCSDDFEFDDCTMSISKSYSRISRKDTEPKNKFSIRIISITKQLSNLVKWYITTEKTNVLFKSEHHNDRILKKMKFLSDELGIAMIKFHGLRHSHVSYLLHNHVDISYISKRVGHANISVTLSTYSHMLKEKEEEQEKLTLETLNINEVPNSPQKP